MPARFIRRPNGYLARFSTVVDNVTHVNLTPKEAVLLCEQERMQFSTAVEKVRRGAEDIQGDFGPPGSGLDRWNEAIESIRHVHGEKETTEIIELCINPPEDPDPDMTWPTSSMRNTVLLDILCKIALEHGVTIDPAWVAETLTRMAHAWGDEDET